MQLNEKIQDILKQEIIATKTYSKLFQEIDLKENATKLRKILRDHQEAVVYWREQGGEINNKTLDLCLNVNTVNKASPQKLNNQSILNQLRLIESKELSTYKDLLCSFKLEPSHRSYIKTVLLPAQKDHLKQIQGIETVSKFTDSKERTNFNSFYSLNSDIA